MNFTLKQFSLGTSLLALACALPAAQAADFEDYARVINVQPQVEQINMPRQECRTEYETIQRPQERSNSGGIIGGIAGGLLGSQVGGGNGRIAAAAAGALTGAIVGDRMDNNNQQGGYDSRPIRQCRTVDSWQTRTNGYAVTYEYNGRTYTSVMPYDPGSRLRLHVSLTPRP
ncbi:MULTISPECIES: glycine zipper 2TM domain-containing protein [Undibacterium]|uniref:Glycine zipper 2TM domain-containing protein n=2 Tax=Undibacterium TaxID=401469 RepID=A0A850QJB1_9BURK|nr:MULTISPECIES: glycine zipper 2TM domain-containing protein [Undibacterium]MBC3870873.1 glycine zipper 2TM domain-containing protein [Undibacterium oligocarboniphilum]MBC3885826.1 glycine zipper 2TM domain-containing protein [Undibacterium griseum]NVO76504.1 glycine zipper 2TM domain-containing protein [Undibacterium oligocarboniphilum]